jgi:hypothetical protein
MLILCALALVAGRVASVTPGASVQAQLQAAIAHGVSHFQLPAGDVSTGSAPAMSISRRLQLANTTWQPCHVCPNLAPCPGHFQWNGLHRGRRGTHGHHRHANHDTVVRRRVRHARLLVRERYGVDGDHRLLGSALRPSHGGDRAPGCRQGGKGATAWRGQWCW